MEPETYLLTDWTLYDYGDYRYLRGRPIGHPNKPSCCVIMTTPVLQIEGNIAATAEMFWILGEAA